MRSSVDWNKYEHLLGEIPDSEIAEIVGLSASTVGYHRRKRGIGRYRSDRVKVSFTLPPEVAHAVDETADAHDTTKSELVERALRDHLGM